MSQIIYKYHIQSGCAHGQHHERVGASKISKLNSTRPMPRPAPHLWPGDISRLGRQRQKHRFKSTIGLVLLLHLLQHLSLHYTKSASEPHGNELISCSAPLNHGGLFLLAKADASFLGGDTRARTARDRETARIDSLLRLPQPPEREAAHRIPLDFIKNPPRQRDESHRRETGNGHHGHYARTRPSHNLHQRHRHRYSTSQLNSSDISQDKQHDHHSRGRNKRHNDMPSFYDGGAADRPIVATKKGLIKGITQRIFTGKFVDAFLGIPFAQPPIGKYRFRHPQPINPWPGELDASRLSNSCYQVNDTFFGPTFGGTSIWNANTPLNEDCLHLNIWTPFGVANTSISETQNSGYSNISPGGRSSSASKRAVLVWIFGGGFYSGTPTLSLYEGGALASEEDIIVVSINYRVSALGFLYFGRPDAPGNAGLFDQLLALQWINDNIEQFGGDPERVTIFGESAGAVSVAYHLLSPLSRNLFSQAILQSGAATCPWGLMDVKDIVANGLQLAASLNCSANPSDLEKVIECLRGADAMALVSQEVGQTRSIINFPFVPVVDGSFLLESPIESLVKSNFKPARILLGSNNDEGGSYLVYMSEFSHCPSNNSTVAQANSQQASQAAYSSPSQTKTSLDSAASTDLRRDLNFSMDDTENLDASRSEHPADSIGYQRQTLSSSYIELEMQQTKNFSGQRSAAANQKQQQLEYLQNESKPCTPNQDLSLTRNEFLKVLREDINPYAEHPVGKKAIVFEYSNWNNPLDPVSNYDGLDKIVGDYYFTCHVNEFAHRYAEAGNAVYMYYFKQRSSQSPWPKWMGVIHADEINFVFGEPLNPAFNYTLKEIELSKRMMKYWANFAKYGNPTRYGDNTTLPEKWPEYADKRSYFELHSDYIRVGKGPRSKQCAFWSQYLPQLIQSYDKNNQCQTTGEPLPRVHPFPSHFIVILILAALVGSFAIISKRTSWKINLWPISGGGNSSPSSPDNEGGEGASRRFRNRRAAASRQREQAAAAAAAAASSGNYQNQSSSAQAQHASSGNSPSLAASTGQAAGGLYQTSTIRMPQQQQPHQIQLVKLQNMRSQQQSTIGSMNLQRQQTIIGSSEQQQEQSALDFAQSAAARVTATGSAAAAMAAAKFKMLRSNTLAAAFGKNENEQSLAGIISSDSKATDDQSPPSVANLVAIRTKGERVNTVSSPSSRLGRFEFNS